MKRNKLLTVLITTICLLGMMVVFFVVLLVFRVNKEYSVEIGQEVSTEVYRKYDWDKGTFLWIEKPDTSTAGVKEGKIQVFPITYRVTLVVVASEQAEPTPTEGVDSRMDTQAPLVTTKNVTVYAEKCDTLKPEQFIEAIEDESECTVEFITNPDMMSYGNQVVNLAVRDTAGNSTEVEAMFCIVNVKESVFWELGSEVPAAEEFLFAQGSSVSFVTDVSTINVMAEENYEVVLLVDGIEAVSVLQIKDTTAPSLTLKQAETWLNKPLEASSFIDYDLTSDNSDAFDTAYVAEPDWSLEGEQVVRISATDASGNTVIEATKVVISKDQKAPVVTVTDIDVKVGGTVSYKKAVSYYDDIDSQDEMKLSIERSNVNLKEVGTYEVTYTVTDCSGNSTSVVGKINVLEESPKWEDEEAIHEKARRILDSILKEGMTDREKAKAIYTWVKNNIGYINHSEKGNYIRGAYEGLFKQQGDCFVYAATSKELLTLAGIQNIDIVKATTNPSHYWNLVYIEDGWYHFDTTPRADKSEFFLLTDAELEAYSSSHKNTHIFDRSLYPEIK